MNQPFLYDPQANVLRQRAEMEPEKPRGDAAVWHMDEYREAHKRWRDGVNTLPAYTPVSGWVPEGGREYTIGVHFQVRFQINGTDDLVHDEYERIIPRFVDSKLVAVPIEQKQEAAPKCICHNEGRYMSCTIRCDRVIAEEEEEQKR